MSMSNFWGNIDDSDVTMPFATVGQPTTKEGEPGKFNFKNGVSVDRITGCRVIFPSKQRKLFSSEGNLLCWSDDFLRPSLRVKTKMNNECLSCPLSAWPDQLGFDESARRSAMMKTHGLKAIDTPLCRGFYALVIHSQSNGLFILSLSGVNFTETKNKLFSRIRRKDSKPFSYEFDLSLRLVTEPNKHYRVVFDEFKATDESELESMTEIATTISMSRMLTYEPPIFDDGTSKDEKQTDDGLPF